MAQAVVMPKFGQTVEEATLVKWHKKEGDPVKKGDVLFEIETDKAVLEAESFFDGILLKVFAGEGDTVPVSSVVAYVGAKGEQVPDKPTAPPPATTKEAPPEPARAEPAAKAPATQEVAAPPPRAAAPVPIASAPRAPVAPPPPAAVEEQRIFISPRAKALARARVISPANISGSGPNGRIVVKDVEAYLEKHGYDQIRISPAAKRLAAREGIDILTVRGSGVAHRIMVRDVENTMAQKPRPLSKMRQVIARRLTDSFTGTPHFYVTAAIDMTDLMTFRQALKDQGKAYSVTDFILEAVILSLQEYPVVNSVCDGNTIRWHGDVDLGMAVSLEDGLVVPVIRNAGDLSMDELHDTAKGLAARARDGKLLPDEMTGSTFTVSNMGMMDVENFHAIINPGEAGILAVSSTIQKPVVHDGEIAVRSIMKITLSVDHRIVDGSIGAIFVNAIKDKLEDVELWKSLT